MALVFNSQTLGEVFRDVFQAERSGVLMLDNGKVTKSVHFDRGMIFFAESSETDEDLTKALVTEGLVSVGAIEEAREALGEKTGCSLALARTLIERDLLRREAAQELVENQIRRVVYSVFRWDRGRCRLEERKAGEAPFDTDTIRTVETVLYGILGMSGFAPILEAMQGLDSRLRIRDRVSFPFGKLPLSSSHGYILSRVDGQTSLTDLLSILPPNEEEVASRFLFALLMMGVLEYDPPLGDGPFKVADVLRHHKDRQMLEQLQAQTIEQIYVQAREQMPHDVLGLAASATDKEIQRAYEDLKGQVRREHLLPRVQEKFKEELTIIDSRLIEAYLSLSQPDTRAAERPKRTSDQGDGKPARDLLVRMEMDKTRSKVEQEKAGKIADTYYAKARRSVREGDFHNAMQYAKLAISYNKSDARYYFLLADCQVRNPEPRWQRMAEENFQRATQVDPWNAEYWISLGQFYKRRGLKLRARRQFEEALKLVPSNRELMAELRSLD